MTPMYVSLGVLAAILMIIYGTVLLRTWCWEKDRKPGLKGLALPEGSVRALLAFLVVGAFVIFIFFGRDVVDTDDLYNTVLTAFGTLTGAISGFYFGTRGAQSSNDHQDGTPGTPPTG